MRQVIATSHPKRNRELIRAKFPGQVYRNAAGQFQRGDLRTQLLLHFFQTRVPNRSQRLQEGARARWSGARTVRDAPNFGAIKNGGDRNVLAHGDFIEGVERGYQLTGAKTQCACEVEHRGARRWIHREPSREMGRRQASFGCNRANLLVDISTHVELREAWNASTR